MHSRTLGSKSMHSESEPVSMRARLAPTLRVSGGYHRGYALQVKRSSLCSSLSLKEFRTPTSTERNTFLLGIVFGQKRHFLFLKQPPHFFLNSEMCACVVTGKDDAVNHSAQFTPSLSMQFLTALQLHTSATADPQSKAK